MGYLTLDEIPEGRLCRPLFIPDDPLWLALFGGALTELTKDWNYEQFGTLTPAEMAAACEIIIAEWYSEICGSGGGCTLPNGGDLFRLNDDGQWQQLDGEEWIPPNGDATIPVVPDIDAPTEAERRCLAAKNAEYVLRLMYEEVADAFAEEFTLEQMLISLAEWLVTKLGAWVGILTTQTALVSLGYLAGFYALLEFLTDDLWTEDFTDNLICLLLYHAGSVGNKVVFDFNAVKEDLVTGINWFDPTLSSVRLAGQVIYLLNIIGAEGLNHAGATTEIENTDCEYCSAWCVNISDENGLGDWDTGYWNNTNCDTQATWDGTEWDAQIARGTGCTGNSVRYVRIVYIPATPLKITDIAAHSPQGAIANRAIYFNGNATLFTGTQVWSGAGYTGGEFDNVTRIDVLFFRAVNDTTPFSLDWVQVSGLNDNPFGEPNC